jgi:hypothetical protein
MEAEYVAACEATKEAVWLKEFIKDLGVMRIELSPMTLFCDNNGVYKGSWCYEDRVISYYIVL